MRYNPISDAMEQAALTLDAAVPMLIRLLKNEVAEREVDPLLTT